jgi:hypothetical protein
VFHRCLEHLSGAAVKPRKGNNKVYNHRNRSKPSGEINHQLSLSSPQQRLSTIKSPNLNLNM